MAEADNVLSADEAWLSGESGVEYIIEKKPRWVDGENTLATRTPESGTRASAVGPLLDIVVGVIAAERRDDVPIAEIHNAVTLEAETAAVAVAELQSKEKRLLPKDQLERAFIQRLLGMKRVDINVDGMRPDAFDGAKALGETFDAEQISNKTGLCRTVITVDSSARKIVGNGLPNFIQVSVVGESGISLAASMAGISQVTLLQVECNESSVFGERPGGSSFYVSIDELTKDYNRQADMHDQHVQFKCTASQTKHGTGLRFAVDTPTITLRSTADLGGNLTLRLWDEQKLPLQVEQDVYAYIAHTWDDVNQAIVFEIPANSIQNADRISIRNIVCTEDAGFFDESKRFRAEVIDLTHIRVYVWRPQGAPFLDPSDGRHLVSSGGQIVCINNIIRVTLAFDHAS